MKRGGKTGGEERKGRKDIVGKKGREKRRSKNRKGGYEERGEEGMRKG